MELPEVHSLGSSFEEDLPERGKGDVSALHFTSVHFNWRFIELDWSPLHAWLALHKQLNELVCHIQCKAPAVDASWIGTSGCLKGQLLEEPFHFFFPVSFASDRALAGFSAFSFASLKVSLLRPFFYVPLDGTLGIRYLIVVASAVFNELPWKPL